MKTRISGILAICLMFAFASAVNADAITTAYWNFETTADTVGGITTIEVGSPDLSINATYGASPGSGGNSLNTLQGGLGAGGGFLEAAVLGGSPIHFGTGSFSFSYWSYNPTDADARGARIFDTLAGTDEGLQLGTDATGIYNYRMDDSMGNSIVSNTSGGLGALVQPSDQWVHVAVTMDRVSNVANVFFDGSNVGTMNISTLTGTLDPTIDMQIGVINGGTVAGQAQNSGLDDLAFYSGVLSSNQIALLSSGAATPDTFAIPEPAASAMLLLGLFACSRRRR